MVCVSSSVREALSLHGANTWISTFSSVTPAIHICWCFCRTGRGFAKHPLQGLCILRRATEGLIGLFLSMWLAALAGDSNSFPCPGLCGRQRKNRAVTRPPGNITLLCA